MSSSASSASCAGPDKNHLPAGILVLAVLAGVLSARTTAGFPLTIDGQVYDWSHVGRFLMPGETLDLVAPDSLSPGWAAAGGMLLPQGGNCVRWVAPFEPGLYPIWVTCGEDVVVINAFTMVPYDSLRDGYLHGFRIGRYPSSNPFPNFVIPDGLIEATAENIDTRISPRHTLREFVPRQPGEFPKYLVLQEPLLVKLELLSGLVEGRGYPCEKLTVFSGYRTPAFHRSRGSGRHSAHIYGGAADIFVDADGDGKMDDLTGDGLHGSRDSRLLASIVDDLEEQHPELVGGCGWYRSTWRRGPFVHIDVRGEEIRWQQ